MVQHLKRCSSNITFLEAIADTEGLLMEILLRLPARPLVRFKCVSKNWLSLISDPKFCHLHTLRNPKPSISAVVGTRSLDFGIIPLGPTSYCGWNPLNRIPHGDDEEIAIIQSCNGLFFCHPQTAVMWAVGASYPAVPPTKKPIYYVLNPTTNHFSTLIPPAAAAATTDKPRVFGYGLAFDPSKSSPHYKVVILWAINEDRDSSQYYHIEIYSSETRSWRLLASSFTTQFLVDYTNGVYCNGALHWVGTDNVMAYYHVDEERVGFVDCPPLPHEKRFPQFRNTCFHENGGRLHLIHIYNCSTKFEVLEMGRDYSGWFVKYNVDLDPLCTAYSWFDDPAILFLHRVENEDKHLQIYEEGEGGSSCLLLHTPGKVISYNLKTNTFKYLDITPLAGYDDSLTRVWSMNFLYMETLACV